MFDSGLPKNFDGSGRLPPANIQAEQSLLGALLSNNKVFEEIAEFLRPEHFADRVHAVIYSAISQCIARGSVADAVTLRSEFEGNGKLEEVGGVKYLAHLLGQLVGVRNARHYALLVYENWVRRCIIDAAQVMTDRAYSGSLDAKDMVTAAITDLEATIIRSGSKSVSILEAADKAVAAGERAAQAGAPGLQTGFPSIDKRLLGMHPGCLYVLGGRPGMGKEQPVDTPVLTPDGWRPIGGLRVGDRIVTASGKSTQITGVFPQGLKCAYRVTFSDGSHTECGLDHLWEVQPYSGRSRHIARVMSLREIMAKGITRPRKDGRFGAKWHIPVMKPVERERIDLPVDPYVLGVMIGDGCMVGKSLRFSTPDIDRDIVERFKDRLPVDVHLREYRGGACPYFEICGEGRRSFRSAIHGLELNVHSGEKFIPPIYLWASIDQRFDLLRGLMDTDGSRTSAGSAVFYSTSQRLAQDVLHLVRSLGAVGWIRQYDRSHVNKPTEYVVNIQISTSPFYSLRKIARWRPRRPARYINSIEPTEMREQVCIMVEDPSHLYVCNDFIVTHNTALALRIALNVAMAGHGVELISLEMNAEQLGQRALADLATVPLFDLISGKWSEASAKRIIAAREQLRDLPFTIDDQNGLSVPLIALKARAAKRRHGLDLLIVDHIQIVGRDASLERRGDTTAAIGQISNGLKRLAKEMGIPVLALAQLKRIEGREDKRPNLDDLRQSGEIEQDADAVLMVYREDYYLGNSPPAPVSNKGPEHAANLMSQWVTAKKQWAGKAEVICAKQRQGLTGTDLLGFNGAMTRFYELEKEEEMENFGGIFT